MADRLAMRRNSGWAAAIQLIVAGGCNTSVNAILLAVGQLHYRGSASAQSILAALALIGVAYHVAGGCGEMVNSYQCSEAGSCQLIMAGVMPVSIPYRYRGAMTGWLL